MERRLLQIGRRISSERRQHRPYHPISRLHAQRGVLQNENVCGEAAQSRQERFAQQGANIAFTYLSSDKKAQNLELELEAYGTKVKGFKSDASNFISSQKLVNDVLKEFGSIDVLVNNAGITKDNLLMRMSEEDFDEVMEVNMKSVFNLTKAVLKPMLKAKNGSIINMSSVVGVKGNAGQSNYSASKAAINGFTKSIALELGSRNIRCNSIAPGFIETDMTNKLNDAQKEQISKNIPTNKMGSPEDIAYAVSFLASDKASYITGETINVNGGLFMQ